MAANFTGFRSYGEEDNGFTLADWVSVAMGQLYSVEDTLGGRVAHGHGMTVHDLARIKSELEVTRALLRQVHEGVCVKDAACEAHCRRPADHK